MKWDAMDARDLKYPSNTFDLIIEKGTMNDILCNKEGHVNWAKVMKECQRVLKVGGYLISISFNTHKQQLFHFKREFLHCKLKTHRIEKRDWSKFSGDNMTYKYITILQKLPGADKISADKLIMTSCFNNNINELDLDEYIDIG